MVIMVASSSAIDPTQHLISECRSSVRDAPEERRPPGRPGCPLELPLPNEPPAHIRPIFGEYYCDPFHQHQKS